LQLIGHFDLWAGIFKGLFRLFIEEATPTLVVRFPAGGDVWLNAAFFQSSNIVFAEIAVVGLSKKSDSPFSFPTFGPF